MTQVNWPTAQVRCVPSGWRATRSLWRREMVHFFRQPRRVVAAVVTPLVFWLLLGSGMNRLVTFPVDSPTNPVVGDVVGDVVGQGVNAVDGVNSMGYAAYFFPGAVVMTVMFATILAAYSVIEDRREGFLQGVLVAPVSRLSVAAGKIFGGATIALLQGAMFMLLWPMVGPMPGLVDAMMAVVALASIAVMLTSVGFILAWPTESTAGFHAVLNLILFPAWFLSGAMFPVGSAPTWLATVMWINPLTWGQAALSSALTGQRVPASAPINGCVAMMVTVGLAGVSLLLAGYVASRVRKDGRS